MDLEVRLVLELMHDRAFRLEIHKDRNHLWLRVLELNVNFYWKVR